MRFYECVTILQLKQQFSISRKPARLFLKAPSARVFPRGGVEVLATANPSSFTMICAYEVFV